VHQGDLAGVGDAGAATDHQGVGDRVLEPKVGIEPTTYALPRRELKVLGALTAFDRFPVSARRPVTRVSIGPVR